MIHGAASLTSLCGAWLHQAAQLNSVRLPRLPHRLRCHLGPCGVLVAATISPLANHQITKYVQILFALPRRTWMEVHVLRTLFSPANFFSKRPTEYILNDDYKRQLHSGEQPLFK